MIDTSVILKDNIEREINEHEVFLSFNSDDGALAFYNWWNDEGEYIFNNYVNKKEKEILL